MNKVLVIGAAGQIGTELVLELRRIKGDDIVIASDIREPNDKVLNSGVFELLDVLNQKAIKELIEKHTVKEVYLLAATLSGTAEKNPEFAWKLNMEGLLNLLNLAKDKVIDKLFWPSSIAVFGPSTPKENTPQLTVMEPNTVYGISKLAGERWCEYYFDKYGVDVRSIRYPGLISYSAPPGGGTTDYAVEIFHKAKENKSYTCYLNKETSLPMMFMEDAIKATIDLMESPRDKVKVRSSYNIAGFSFNPEQLSKEIQKSIPEFVIGYEEDFRQKIAASWPSTIDDSKAQDDWGWKPKYSLQEMVEVMLENV